MTLSEQRRSILCAFAHPDDESFGTGGLLARYVAEGAYVSLVCTTNGDVGEISDPSLATPETLGDVRVGEMKEAARVLGISELIMLGYRDSGRNAAFVSILFQKCEDLGLCHGPSSSRCVVGWRGVLSFFAKSSWSGFELSAVRAEFVTPPS